MALRLTEAAGSSATAQAALQEVNAGTFGPPFTVALWFTIELDRNTTSVLNVIAKNGQASAPFYTAIWGATTSGTGMVIWNGAGTSPPTGSTANVGSWYRFAVVTSSTTAATGYHGSVSQGAAFNTLSQSGLTGTNVYRTDSNLIQFGSNGTGNGWNGRIAAIKMWDAALTEPELQAEFQRYRPVRRTNLVRWMPAIHGATSRNLQNDGDIWAPDHSGWSPVGGIGHLDTQSPTTTYEDGPPIPW